MVRHLKWLIIDVDGTMTDGGVYYDENGNELKKFNTKDAAGIFAAHQAGINLVVLTGRSCKATEKRMRELKIKYLFQNVKDKEQFVLDFMKKYEIRKDEIGYVGDDLNDYLPMQLTGYIACPADSCMEIREIADYISGVDGGDGAVRDIIARILQECGKWNEIIKKIYGAGI